MEEKINEEVLCILKHKENSKEILVDYIPIEFYFTKELKELENLCNNKSNNLYNIIQYIKNTPQLNLLNGKYKYCTKLDGIYQESNVNIENEITRIIELESWLKEEYKDYSERFKLQDKVIEIKGIILNNFNNWIKAYSINKAYRNCFDNKEILTFSHRLSGYSNPEYKLNENFTIEVKTNFGYGNSSYFYVKIKYENIDITPLSEWINYEFAKFSEIIRYSKSFAIRMPRTYKDKRFYKIFIENRNWKNALEYVKDACNCSQNNEIEFIEKYVIVECEKMVLGLENIMINENFTFSVDDDSKYQIDKKGHALIEFRSEKVSGALDFISKIIEYKKITQINSFINRIETINKEIQPILSNEILLISDKLLKLNEELKLLNPEYLDLQKLSKVYNKKRESLKFDLIKRNLLTINNIDLTFLNLNFHELYPEYEQFEKQLYAVNKEYQLLNEKIFNLKKVKKNIAMYEIKIKDYFNNKK